MSMILGWLRLVRPINIILIAITPLALWAVLVRPLFGVPELDVRQVLMLGLALGFVAAAGNVINDIADRTIDQLNERKNPLLDGFPVSAAWFLYVGLNLVALFLTWQLAAELNRWAVASLLPLAILGLAGYSFALKCTPLVGNLLVSAFAAGVPGMVFIAEPMIAENLVKSASAQSLVVYIVIAFFGTLARELVKDLEDKHGDAAAGCQTLAVRWPEKDMLILINACMFIVLSAVAYLTAIWYMANVLTGAISWAALWLLLAGILFTIYTPSDEGKKRWSVLSGQLKMAMAFGLILLILVGANVWN
ncbi:MAG: UbiA family prenyltransferase [Saprospiraceae bacterium]